MRATTGGIRSGSGGDAYALSRRFPGEHWFVKSQRRAVFYGQLKMGLDGWFRKQNAGARFPNRHHVRIRLKSGKASANLR